MRPNNNEVMTWRFICPISDVLNVLDDKFRMGRL